jgi:hypothetical protein
MAHRPPRRPCRAQRLSSEETLLNRMGWNLRSYPQAGGIWRLAQNGHFENARNPVWAHQGHQAGQSLARAAANSVRRCSKGRSRLIELGFR